METKISEGKKKKVEFIEKAKEHEQVIQGLRSALGESLSYLEKGGGIDSSASSEEETSRLSKSLPIMSPSPSSSSSLSVDKYTSQGMRTPGIRNSYGISALQGSGRGSYGAPQQGRHSHGCYSTKTHPRSHV